MALCMWSNSDGSRNFHLANWPSICMETEFGGMGVPDIRDLNVCLLASWVRRYSEGEGKLRRQLIDYKYRTSEPNILHCRDVKCSHLWKGFMWAAAGM